MRGAVSPCRVRAVRGRREGDRVVAAAVGVGGAGAREAEDGARGQALEVARGREGRRWRPRSCRSRRPRSRRTGLPARRRDRRRSGRARGRRAPRPWSARPRSCSARGRPPCTRRSSRAGGATRCRSRPSIRRRASPCPLPPSPPPPVPSSRPGWPRARRTDRTRSARMSLSPPSLVSPTTALTLRTSSLPGQDSTSATTPSTAAPTARVLVRTMGDSIVPSSWTCVAPASLPKAFPTKIPAATLSRKTLPACGHDRGHAGADAVALDERDVADAHARHVRDRVGRARREHAGGEADLARPRPSFRGGRRPEGAQAPHEHRHHQREQGHGASLIAPPRAFFSSCRVSQLSAADLLLDHGPRAPIQVDELGKVVGGGPSAMAACSPRRMAWNRSAETSRRR